MASKYAGIVQDELRDLRGNAMQGAVVIVREVGTTTPATVYNNPVLIAEAAGGDALANDGTTGLPAASGLLQPGLDANGNYTFYADADVSYDLRVLWNGLTFDYRVRPKVVDEAYTSTADLTAALAGTYVDSDGTGELLDASIPVDRISQSKVNGLPAALAGKLPALVIPASFIGTAVDFYAQMVTFLDDLQADGGGMLWHPGGGLVRLSAPIDVDDYANITIAGPNWRAGGFECEAGFLQTASSPPECRQIKLRDFEVKCLEPTNTFDGIAVFRPRRWSIKRLYIDGFGNDSIKFGSGLQSVIEQNYIKAKDSTSTNGHAGIYLTDDAGTIGTTHTTVRNFIATGVQYGYLVDKATAHCVSHGDIPEFCDVGMRWDGASGTIIAPFTEANRINGLELHNSSSTVIRPREDPVVTWGAVSEETKYIIQLGQRDIKARDFIGRTVENVGSTGELLTTGETTLARHRINSRVVPMASGALRGLYFTAQRSEDITKIAMWSGAVAAGATPTLCRAGIWTAQADGTLIDLVASIPNDTTLFNAIDTEYERALSATFAKVRGQRYFAGILVVTGAQAPQLVGYAPFATNSSLSALYTRSPRLIGADTAQTDLDSPAPSVLSSSAPAPFMELRT